MRHTKSGYKIVSSTLVHGPALRAICDALEQALWERPEVEVAAPPPPKRPRRYLAYEACS